MHYYECNALLSVPHLRHNTSSHKPVQFAQVQQLSNSYSEQDRVVPWCSQRLMYCYIVHCAVQKVYVILCDTIHVMIAVHFTIGDATKQSKYLVQSTVVAVGVYCSLPYANGPRLQTCAFVRVTA
jgi:hypothetical protein